MTGTLPPLPVCRRPRPLPERGLAAFTLVELLIVVVILSILAAVAIPQLNSERSEAVVSSLMANVNLVSMTIEYQHQRTESGAWPEVVDPGWFSSRRYPYHPDQPDGVPQVENVRQPNASHPASKVLTASSAGAYWYNSANGIFRARVTDQGGSAATLDMYNRVNQSSLTSLSGGGSGELAPVESLSEDAHALAQPVLPLGG